MLVAGASLSPRNNISSPLQFTLKKPPLFPNSIARKFVSRRRHRLRHHLTLASKPDGGVVSTSVSKQPLSNNTLPPSFNVDDIVFVDQENVHLEGVIQFNKPASSFFSRLDKWGHLGLFAGGDVLALPLFSAIGRFSHGLYVFYSDTLRTADSFVAEWFLGAYFLGGYGEDGRGMNGVSNAVIAALKSSSGISYQDSNFWTYYRFHLLKK